MGRDTATGYVTGSSTFIAGFRYDKGFYQALFVMEESAGMQFGVSRVKQAWHRFYSGRIDRWETQLACRTTDRMVREFEWGLDWTDSWPCRPDEGARPLQPAAYIRALNEAAVLQSDRFFGYVTPGDFRLEDGILRFTSPVSSPHMENNTVVGQWFPAKSPRKRAALVLPHWNSKAHHHLALTRGLSRLGISALRVSLPYHDFRMPGGLNRADYAVSSNVGRTLDATRQAVIDTRACLDWLEHQGYERLGIVGTSLGSCIAFLASAQDARVRSNVFNLFSLHFADVVWTGLSTRHIRESLEGRIALQQLRDAWNVITPSAYVELYARQRKASLFIYGAHDTTFLPEYSRAMIEEVRRCGASPKVVEMPCGHYTMGEIPFKFIDGYHICSFLLKTL